MSLGAFLFLVFWGVVCARARNPHEFGGDPGVLPAAACVDFKTGLCPGSAGCECKTTSVCSPSQYIKHENSTQQATAGACEAQGGECRQVIHGQCPGGSNCLAYGPKCGSPGGCVNRTGILAKAHEWAKKKIPYCQCNGPQECCGNCPYCGTFRCDCSGYVSYCWDLPYGYTTSTLHEVAHRITKEEMVPGDVMLCPGDHVVMFTGWAYPNKTAYHACQEPGCHVTWGPHHAYCSIVTYPFIVRPDCFKPYRLNNVCPPGHPALV
eukprot:TRINITY_DN29110_c0_g1_i1.p1 TRINITY_DN29110_c0_g1~~TRINITY_DN29110_c0_g1_i1.p1  ORF type:complete len:265 (+),score=-8.52 TRINITY_DN29110_c0_g1_i1:19-813(+)